MYTLSTSENYSYLIISNFRRYHLSINLLQLYLNPSSFCAISQLKKKRFVDSTDNNDSFKKMKSSFPNCTLFSNSTHFIFLISCDIFIHPTHHLTQFLAEVFWQVISVKMCAYSEKIMHYCSSNIFIIGTFTSSLGCWCAFKDRKWGSYVFIIFSFVFFLWRTHRLSCDEGSLIFKNGVVYSISVENRVYQESVFIKFHPICSYL